MVRGHKVSVVKILREPECNSVIVLRSRRVTELHGPSSRKTSSSELVAPVHWLVTGAVDFLDVLVAEMKILSCYLLPDSLVGI
jgi:hypothetical protein